jgi:hypothetical protein
MLTCKDCLCYEACSYHVDEETTLTVNDCSTGFKNKHQYVKLPAYIGQQVWIAGAWWHYSGAVKSEVKEGKVSMIQQKADGSWKIRVSVAGSVLDYTTEEFNKRVFLTEEAAEEDRIRRVEAIRKERGITK